MVRGTLFVLVAGLLLACGGESSQMTGQDAGGGDNGNASPQASSPSEGAAGGQASSPTDGTAPADEASVTAGVSQRCLRLVADRDFEAAIPVCTEALGVEPSNLDVEQALSEAQSEVASAAVDAAAKEKAGAASKLLE